MEQFELINSGLKDSMNILSMDEMNDIVGGDTVCSKGFIMSNGTISCKCGFKTPIDLPIKNGDLTAPVEKPGTGKGQE